MKHKRVFLYSILVSLITHTLFFAAATGIKIPGVYNILDRSKRFFNIKSVEKEITQKKPLKKRGITYADTLKFKSPLYAESIESPLDKDEKEMEKPDIKTHMEEMTEPLQAKPIDELDNLIENDKIFQEEHQRQTRGELVEVAALPDEEAYAGIRDPLGEPELPEYFFEKMPGFTPEAGGTAKEGLKKKDISEFEKRGSSDIRRKTDFEDIDEYLICELSTYEDPSDGQKYFKIGIKAGKDAEGLPKLPKEMVFLLDCSLSMQPERLAEFKKGLHYCLNHLNPEDVFNIMAFKEKNIWFRPHSIKPDRVNIQDALNFVDALSAGQGTDAYRALYETIQIKEAMIPSYVMLFSDGRPTYGVTDSRQIMNEISKVNNGERPIFAFSGGLRVNRYFLDFISYKNRGWTEYAERQIMIGRRIARMYEKIKDPIFLNLRYNVSGLDSGEVFPKTLPDFYSGAEFTLYGRYSGENEFSLQLLGDTEEETNEFIVVGSLENAAKGGKDIARNWAFNKIYHLIGLLEYGRRNEAAIEEINRLCEKFGIKTPYSDGIKQ